MKTLIDLTFILNGALGFVCAFIVLLSIRSNRTVNIFLAIMIFGASFRFVTRGYLELTDQMKHISNFSKSIAYVFGFSLPYLYFKKLVFHEKNLNLNNLLHFILPTLLIVENKFHLIEHYVQAELNGVISVLLIAQFLFYFILSTHMLIKHIWKKPGGIEIELQQEKLLKKWTFILFLAFTFMGLRLIFALVFMQNNEFISDNYFVWINSLAWFVVFMMIITSPAILNGYIGQISRDRQEGSKSISFWRLKPVIPINNTQDFQLSQKINGDLENYFSQIDQFTKEKHTFRRSDLAINDLAMTMKIPKSHLSFIFKYHSTISFSDFKKLNRIQDAIALIDEGYLKTNTFDSLSKKVGFSTYNTFFIAFKEVTNKAPQEFVNSAV
jgi:AraC-like DNA-binding protein